MKQWRRLEYRVSIDIANNKFLVEAGNAQSGSTTWSQVGVARSLSDGANPYYAQGVVLGANSAPATLRSIFPHSAMQASALPLSDGTAEATVTQGTSTAYNVGSYDRRWNTDQRRTRFCPLE